MRVELGLACAGIRHRPGPWMLLAAGVAIAATLPLVAAGLGVEASVSAVRSALTAVPPASRAVLAVTSRDLRGEAGDRVDKLVRAGFADVGVLSPVRSLTFRSLSLAGQDVTLGAVDQLASSARLVDGRLPERCTPAHCEVLAVAAPGATYHLDVLAASRAARELGVTITGTAQLADNRLVGVGLAPGDLPLLLGSDPAAIAELDSLALFGRNLGWYGTLDGAAVASRGVPAFSRELAGIADAVNAESGPLSVSWPAETAAAAADRATASTARFAVLGVGAAALELGFGIVVAAGMRSRQQLVGRLLARRGGSPGQIVLSTALQPALVVPVGVITGLVVGTAVVAWTAADVLPHPLSAALAVVGANWPTLAALAVAAVAIVLAVARWPAEGARIATWLLSSALVVTIALPLLIVTGAPGSTASTLSTSAIVSLIIAAGLLAARLWAPLLAVGSRLAGRAGADLSRVITQVAVLVARRRPLLGMATAGFLAAACCSLVFANGYQSSLRQSALDQAAYQVPLDVRVAPSSRVAVPLDVLDTERLRRLSPDVAVYPVVSSPVTAFGGTTQALALPLTGIDPSTLPAMHEFAAATGASLSATELAERLRVQAPAADRSPTIPAGVSTLSLHVTGMSSDITLALWLSTVDGRDRQVQFSGSGPDLVARIDAGRYRSVRALEINESEGHLTARQHGIGEGKTDRPLPTGDLLLGSVATGGRPLPWTWAGWGSDQAKISGGTADGGAIKVHYQIGDARVVLVPGYAPTSAAAPLPVAVDARTAARAGNRDSFGISVNGQTVPVRVVTVLSRLPGVGTSFLLADRAAVVSLLERTAPGTAAVSQVWIGAPGSVLGRLHADLESSPAAAATLGFRSDIARALAEDPVATRSIALLTVAGAIALALAMVAVATAVRADLEQTAADQFALEVDGLTTVRLRRIVWLRAALILLAGIPVGVLVGLVLSALAVRLLVTGPGGAAVEPGLRVVFGLGSTLLVVAAAIAGGLLASAAATATALRRRLPRQPEVDLR